MGMVRDINVAQLGDFDEIIDVRSPAEYADDHIPGALSAPVLDDEERARIGTLYKQVSPFAAKKAGAVLIARNIALHLETQFAERPKQWKPLVYCWRGGQRSGAMAHILAQVGWSVGKLQGGYKSYRHHVIDELDTLPEALDFQVLCGPTGSGKSRLLLALAAQGAQVLDLEVLAQHRGSLLGNLPDTPQPSQKLFETRLWDALRRFDTRTPVFVEAESRKIGALSLPDSLLEKVHLADCIALEAALPARVALLKEDYAHFLRSPALITDKLSPLTELHGRKVIEQWADLAERGAWDELVAELLTCHYDPAYQRSTAHNFPALRSAKRLQLDTLDDLHLRKTAQNLILPK
ncbi:MAG: tRNA 2-selenouridine(34) synthase MnmH [Nitrosomonadales bacterium]|nr:tRNA 2-selenouridine(34) synthase MnmH [Nitrosomonadales bacterium]